MNPRTPVPLSLDTVALHGITVGGIPAVECKLKLQDGRCISVDLPSPEPSTEDDTPSMRVDVRQWIDALPKGETFTSQSAADGAGYSNSGKLRKFLKSLSDLGHILKLRGNAGYRKP